MRTSGLAACGPFSNATTIRILLSMIVAISCSLHSSKSAACSCANKGGPNYRVEQAHSILVAIPYKAEVVQRTKHIEEIRGTLRLLDVLKGPTPAVLPTMIASIESRLAGCSEGSFQLGTAYVLFLRELNQATLYMNNCNHDAPFTQLRTAQEYFCFEGHPERENYCSMQFLDLLRSATTANEKFGFGDAWLDEHLGSVRQRVEKLNRRRSQSP